MALPAKQKTYLLGEFSSRKDGVAASITDPIGKPAEFYREVFGTIKDSIDGFLKWLEE